jgi:ABC-type glycerol-3-phosphate transport system substrate-binding protein
MTTAQMLDDRYGRRSTRRGKRFWTIFTAVGVAIAVAIAAWFAFGSGTTTEASTTGFALVDEHTVTVSFQVSAPAGESIACVLEAQDEEHGVVGWKVVEYPASDDHSQAFQETIPVTAPATTGFVNNCWVS